MWPNLGSAATHPTRAKSCPWRVKPQSLLASGVPKPQWLGGLREQFPVCSTSLTFTPHTSKVDHVHEIQSQTPREPSFLFVSVVPQTLLSRNSFQYLACEQPPFVDSHSCAGFTCLCSIGSVVSRIGEGIRHTYLSTNFFLLSFPKMS